MSAILNAGSLGLIAGLVLVTPAVASETITYTYDARGRLVAVMHSGTVNNGVQTTYTYDQADNRTNVTVTGGADAPGGGETPPTYRVLYAFNGRFFVSIIRD